MEPESIDGYSAWISINNVKLSQYGRTVTVAAPGNKEVTCWVASEVEKEFAVNWRVPPSKEQMLGKLWIDGQAIRNQPSPLHKPNKFRPMPIPITVSYERVSATSVRPLVFSRRELTDDDTHVDKNVEHLGDIRVDIWIVKLIHAKASLPKYANPQPSAKTHERSKKATVSHHVGLGKEYTSHAPPPSSPHTKIRPVISFIFKYRPQDFLQAEGIMPFTPKPDTGSHKRKAETLELSDSDDDHEEMLKRQKEELQIRKEELLKEELRVRSQESELQAQLDRVQAKRHRKKVKLEPQPSTSLPIKTEIIDLT